MALAKSVFGLVLFLVAAGLMITLVCLKTADPDRRDPGIARAWVSTARAMLHYTRGEYPQAEREAREGIRLDPAYVPARRQLAKTLLELHLAEQAVSEFREAARLDPQDAESGCALMIIFRDQKRWDELLPVMDDLARMDSHVARMAMFPKLRKKARKKARGLGAPTGPP